jgi:peptide subunit release factor 1 (eRF1)
VLKTRVAAVVRAEGDAGDAQILEQALEVERRIEADEEDRLVSEVVEIAGSAARATCGVDPTLEALWAGDVRTLIIAEALPLTGTGCSNCGRLHRGEVSICPRCGASTHLLPDFGHHIAVRAVAQGGRVEVVHTAAAERLTKAGEGLAALLRFPWPARLPADDEASSLSEPQLSRRT